MPNYVLNPSIETSKHQLKISLKKAQKLSTSMAREISEHSIDFLLSA